MLLWVLLIASRTARRASPLVVAFGLSAMLLGCGAAPAVAHGPWAQTLLSGVRVFRVCRRHPQVNPKATYWYEEGDGTPRTALVPIEEIVETGSVKAAFIHDPHAPPESRRLLGLAFQDLPCDEPPPLPPPSRRRRMRIPRSGP